MMLRHLVSSRLVRWLNRKLNLLAWMVATLAPWRRPFAPHEREAMTAAFDTEAKRERILDLFEAMGRQDAFMTRTADVVRERLHQVPALILFGQLDPMRLVGGARRYARLFARAATVLVPYEEHFPILAAGDEVASAIATWHRGDAVVQARVDRSRGDTA